MLVKYNMFNEEAIRKEYDLIFLLIIQKLWLQNYEGETKLESFRSVTNLRNASTQKLKKKSYATNVVRCDT